MCFQFQDLIQLKHALLHSEHFLNSEVKPKGLQWPKLATPCSLSAWTSAKRCPARVRPSTSLSLLARTSPSPWTPGARKQAQWLWWGRRQAPPPWEEMQGERRNSCKGSRTLQLWNPVKWKLLSMLFLVTSATSNQPLKRGWCSTRGWSTDHPSCPQHRRLLNAPGISQGLQGASLHPLCWTPTGRTSLRRRRS